MARTLACIAAQTDQRFRLYVGDDASPEPLGDIVRGCTMPADRIVYRRFEANLGRKSLTQHWDRCIRLSHEPWVWLFSDDDLMSEDCVASLLEGMQKTGEMYDLYRFNTVMVDANDHLVAMNPPHPEWETWNQFAYFLLRQLRQTVQQEMIFRRASYDRLGGFLDVPLAWASDHAFAIACGQQSGMYTIKTGRIGFRQSGANISSQRDRATDRLKFQAVLTYVTWLADYIKCRATCEFPGQAVLGQLVGERFLRSLRVHIDDIRFGEVGRVVGVASACLPMSKAEARLCLVRYWLRARLLRSRRRGAGCRLVPQESPSTQT